MDKTSNNYWPYMWSLFVFGVIDGEEWSVMTNNWMSLEGMWF